MEDRELKNYEIGFLVRNEEDAAEIANLIKAHHGQIRQDAKMKRLKFAYPINKETSGYFGFILFSLDPGQVKGLTAKLKLNALVVRSMIFCSDAVVGAARQDLRDENRGQQETREPAEQIAGERLGADMVDNELLEKKLEEILK